MGKPKGKKIGKWMLLALAAVLVVCAGFVGSSLLTERPAVAVMSVYQETFADTAITEEADGGYHTELVGTLWNGQISL